MTIIARNQQEGFRRFVLAVQYHGGNYLGATVSSSPEKEEILMKGRSVSGRIMDALHGELCCGEKEKHGVLSCYLKI